MSDPIIVAEPDLTMFEVWLASNPDEKAVERWLRAIEAFYMRQWETETSEERQS